MTAVKKPAKAKTAGAAADTSQPSRRAVDSSVAIPAMMTAHAQHNSSEEALAASDLTIAHVAVETYSVLTRMPPPYRLDAETAADIVERRFPSERIALDPAQQASAISKLAEAGVAGGATYDGLIALTALEHDVELISRDQRAARTYSAIGARFQLLA